MKSGLEYLLTILLFIFFFLLLLACQVLICDFHREHAWERWLNAMKNGARMIKEVVLRKFRHIAEQEVRKN